MSSPLFSEMYYDFVREQGNSSLPQRCGNLAKTPELVKQFSIAFLSEINDNDRDVLLDDRTKKDYELIEESAYALDEFLAGFNRPVSTYLRMIYHDPDATIELGWHDQIAGEVSWEIFPVKRFEDPVYIFVLAHDLVDATEYSNAPMPPASVFPPLYQYHPERFKAFREYTKELGQYYADNVPRNSGMLNVDQLNALMMPIIMEMNSKSMKYPRRYKDALPSPSFITEAENMLATAYGRFVQAGKQILDFPPLLTSLLHETDIDDIQLAALNLPYSSQYLYFGPQKGLELEPGWFFDGAYVEQRGEKGDIRFTITAAPEKQDLSKLWYIHPEPQYTQDFVLNYRTMDIATAVDTLLSQRLSDLKKRIAPPPNLPFSEGFEIKNIQGTTSEERERIVEYRHPVYKSALQLIVNALCYVTAYQDDIIPVWPEKTPLSLKVKATTASKEKERKRAQSKLESLGYVPIHLCGQRIIEQTQKNAALTEQNNGASRSLHWRRGHWRNQVYGASRSLRKLIWIMPVMVGTGIKESDVPGHLYLVS